MVEHQILISNIYRQYSHLLLQVIQDKKIKQNLRHSSIYMSDDNSVAKKSLPLSKYLIANRIKDIIHFYSKILTYLFNRIDNIKVFWNESSNIVEHKLALKYLNSLDKLLTESLEQANAHETGLFDNYLLQEISKLEQKIADEISETKQESNAIIDIDE